MYWSYGTIGVLAANDLLVGPIYSLVFVIATTYTVVSHRLLDVHMAVRRGSLYLGLLAVVISFYLSLVFALSILLHQAFDKDDVIFLSADIATVCAGIFIVPLIERHLRRITDRFFFKDKYHYPQALLSLSAILNTNIETATIVRRTVHALRGILKTAAVHLVIFEERSDPRASRWHAEVQALASRNQGSILLVTDSDRLREQHGIALIAPIVSDQRVLGAVVLGPKLSGDPYYKEDMELLATFSSQAAVALEKARLFEEVRNHSNDLERRVRERTAELEQLQEEQRQMIIDISHRLQTPLTAIKSELDFMRRRMDSSKHMDAFERSIDGISKFIYDLLNLATLDIRRDEFQKEPVDLSELLCGLVEYFGVMAEAQKIDLIARIEPHIVIVASREQMEELATNLVSNSFKYLNAGHAKKVMLGLSKNAAGKAVFVVENSGRGIMPEDLKKIFSRFYRGTRSPEAPAGTGLGLAIAKKIVENHSGVIVIESELGQGTKVIIELPLAG